MEQQQKNDDIDALEQPEAAGAASAPKNDEPKKDIKNKKSRPKGKLAQRIIGHFNVYLLVFILLVIIVIGVTIVSYNQQKNNIAPADIPSQQLDESAFGQLQGGDTSVGDERQTLTVQSNAIFAGQVLARSDVEIAGNLKIGASLNIPGLVVSGDATFGQIQANDISIDGDANIQGRLNITQGLTVAGAASFGGPVSAPIVSTESLQISGDLQFTRHIDAGGPTPSKTNGSALGGGGTVSISGTDTAGAISINTGGGASPGCFITITFAQAFGATPHVVVTPIGANAAAINYYVTRSTTGFSVCAANNPPSSSNFGFDYIVIE